MGRVGEISQKQALIGSNLSSSVKTAVRVLWYVVIAHPKTDYSAIRIYFNQPPLVFIGLFYKVKAQQDKMKTETEANDQSQLLHLLPPHTSQGEAGDWTGGLNPG